MNTPDTLEHWLQLLVSQGAADMFLRGALVGAFERDLVLGPVRVLLDRLGEVGDGGIPISVARRFLPTPERASSRTARGDHGKNENNRKPASQHSHLRRTSSFLKARGAPPPLALARGLRASLGPQALSLFPYPLSLVPCPLSLVPCPLSLVPSLYLATQSWPLIRSVVLFVPSRFSITRDSIPIFTMR